MGACILQCNIIHMREKPIRTHGEETVAVSYAIKPKFLDELRWNHLIVALHYNIAVLIRLNNETLAPADAA